MSRAYRIRVSESERRVLRAEDHVRSELEVLDILPAEEMADLLAQELERRGFSRAANGKMQREGGDGVTVTIDPAAGSIEVRAETKEEAEIRVQRDARGWDDYGPSVKALREQTKRELKEQIQREAERRSQELQDRATERLEEELADLQQELDQIANRVAAEALKRKAAAIGQIKEMTEDQDTGNLTIVVEV